MEQIKAPWLSGYGEVPAHLEYPLKTMSGMLYDSVSKDPDFTALSFMGRHISYKSLAEEIEKVAKAFYAIGVRAGQRVMVCMPNVPQAVYALYALNRIGAVATMVHPLSAVGEIVYYLTEAECDVAVTLDQFYSKFLEVKRQQAIGKLIIARISDGLSFFKGSAYRLWAERKLPKITVSEDVLTWNDFLKKGETVTDGYAVEKDPDGEAVVLFSGGTTGTSKGIMLSDMNFNSLALQTGAMCNECVCHSKMLAAMPVFHGFGLAVCVHTMMVFGGTSILVPRFNVKSYSILIKKNKPNFIAGVPTLYEGVSNSKYLDGVDLSCLKGVFSGGDSLTVALKKKFDAFLADHHATVRVREGYGTTECTSACCLTPYNKEKEGSIGLPFPDTYFKICAVGTMEEVPYGVEGEICLTGPSMMLGYIHHEEENAITLRRHSDGRVWLHTGDLGTMDDEGFVYFRQRIKRMIVTSGYNVYPAQVENILEDHPAVKRACVIGVPDPYKMQKVKAFVTLNDGYEDSPMLRESIMEHCRSNIAKFALPYTIEVLDSIPMTLVGKVAYSKLS